MIKITRMNVFDFVFKLNKEHQDDCYRELERLNIAPFYSYNFKDELTEEQEKKVLMMMLKYIEIKR